MGLLPNKPALISRLNHDILWHIFYINSWLPVRSWDPPGTEPDDSPLTNTRRSSQVCSFWRSIILESPAIWGNCIDLGLLLQDHDGWRREVLRRTGTALLTVRDRHSVKSLWRSEMGKFIIDIISDHWERVKVLDIPVAEEIVGDLRVQNAFSRPARNLTVFAIRDVRLNTNFNRPAFTFPSNTPLFANDAPLLIHFSADQAIFSSSTLIPIPSILRTGQLRHLTLKTQLVIPALELLSACAQMPLLEELWIEIENLIVEDSQDHHRSTSLLPPISLPGLNSIWIISQCLEIYPEFLGRLIAHPSKLQILTSLSFVPSHLSGMPGRYADETRDTLPLDMFNSFQGHHSVWSGSIKYLELGLSDNHILLAANQEVNTDKTHQWAYNVQLVFDRNPVPSIIRKSFINMLLHLNLPTTLLQFKFMPESPWNVPSLSPFFLSLGSITELHTNMEGLSYIVEWQSDSEGVTFFESLRVVVLQDTGDTQNGLGIDLKRFLTARTHTAPVEVLDLTKSRGSFGDLRYLGEIVGLTVVWGGEGEVGRMEYACGSGNPECLLDIKI